MRILASIVALCLGASAASAATYTYQLNDHPSGNQQATYDYGLRLDGPGKYFTFQKGNAYLFYDDVAMTAKIWGTVNESTAVDQTSAIDTSLLYTMSGISDAGGGYFTATGGSGSVGGIALSGKQAMQGQAAGLAFLFLNDGHRGYNGISGRGWIDYTGTNDFLFTATPSQVPVPAAGLLLLSGFGALGLMRRRRKQA